MYLRTILIVSVLATLALFTVVNWQAFTSPTELSLILGTAQVPLGLILLGVVALLTALFLLYVVYLQSSVLFDARRHARELQAQRELADHAESSRFNDLRLSIETQLKALQQENQSSKAELLARLDQLESDLQQSVEQCQNSLAASLSVIDDRLERAIGQ